MTTKNGYGSSTSSGTGLSKVELDEHLKAVARLEAELHASRLENYRLRQALQMSAETTRIADQAYRDARLFVAALHADEDVSRPAMQHNHGMTRRRWEWARALMRLAEITDSYYRLKVWNVLTAEKALLAARDSATENPKALRRYLPRVRRNELS